MVFRVFTVRIVRVKWSQFNDGDDFRWFAKFNGKPYWDIVMSRVADFGLLSEVVLMAVPMGNGVLLKRFLEGGL